MQRYSFILKRLYGFRMYHLCPIKCHFYHFVKTEFGNKFCISEFFGVRTHHTFHVLPYRLTFRVEQICENCRRVITSFTSQRCAFIFIRAADKTLCKQDVWALTSQFCRLTFHSRPVTSNRSLP